MSFIFVIIVRIILMVLTIHANITDFFIYALLIYHKISIVRNPQLV